MTEDRRSTTTWQRSTRCDSGACVEMAHHDGSVLVRNSSLPGAVLTLSVDQWHTLLRAIRAGELRPADG